MSNHFQIERLQEIHAMALETKQTTEMSRETDRFMSRRVLQWVMQDFEANPSADNFERLNVAMLTYQHWMKNVKLIQKQVA